MDAALDVLEYEETIYEKLHFENMPDSLQFLIDSDNVIFSPHIAGNTKETEIKMAENLAHKIINAFEK